MEKTGRGASEKAMIIIPAGVLLFVVMIVTGGPVQFVRVMNFELRKMSSVIGSWVSFWF
jgi:hypothetical protein